MKEIRFIQGNEACALGAIRAGLTFYAGYPITPSSEVAEVCSVELPKIGGRFIQMEDEIASICAIIGASLSGAKTFTATSGPGFSLMQEALGYAVMAEVPIVIVNSMRGGPSTGHPTGVAQGDIMQARWGTHGDHPIVAIYPDSIEEIYYECIRAFNIAEKFRQPVVFLIDEILSHMRESIEIDPHVEIINRTKITVDPKDYKPYRILNYLPQLANYGEGYRFHVTGLYHDETGFPDVSGDGISLSLNRLHNKISENISEIEKWEELCTDDMEILLLAVGSQARSAKMAVKMLRKKGIRAGLFRPITLWPFPEKQFIKLASKVPAIVVPEMNLGQLAGEVKKYVNNDVIVDSYGVVNSKLIHPFEIVARVEGVLKNVKHK